jgi:MATE family multidrug resistance protein
MSQICSVMYISALSLGYSCAAIVGMRLGSGDVFGAKWAGVIIVGTSLVISSVWIMILMLLRVQIADLLAGGEDIGVSKLVIALTPLAALYHAFDSFQAAMTGVVKGTGQLTVFAAVIFVCYWVIGLPLVCLLTFYYQMGVYGMWTGMVVAAALQSLSYLYMLLFRVSFTEAAKEAAARVDAESENHRLPLLSDDYQSTSHY